MAKMIPEYVDEDVPDSERQVFEKLKTDRGTRDWVVLHSLGLARRQRLPFGGEIDFVVIIPGRGIVCLEVKGCGISCKGGEWRSIDRDGNVNPIKNPFHQANNSMHALRDAMRQHFGEGAPESQCPVGFAVVFPDVSCPPSTPEFNVSDVIARDDLQAIARSIARVHLPVRRADRVRLPSPSHVRKIKDFLSPDFVKIPKKTVRIERAAETLRRLADEQYRLLSMMDGNDRCLQSWRTRRSQESNGLPDFPWLISLIGRREAGNGASGFRQFRLSRDLGAR